MRHSFFILGFALLLCLCSCEKKYITEEYIDQHVDQYVSGAEMQTFTYVVEGSDWQFAEQNGRKYWYVEYDNEFLSQEVIDNGAVISYMLCVYNTETGASSWNTLPYVYPYVYVNENNDTLGVGETFRFEYELGKIAFIIEDLDAYEPDAMEDESTFKVVILEGEKK